MKKTIIPIMSLFAALILVVSCGKKEESSGVPGKDKTTEMSTDVGKFLEDYEAFVNEYCDVVKEIQKAPLQRKGILAQKLALKAKELPKYSNQILAIKASASSEAQKKLEELQKKVDECSPK